MNILSLPYPIQTHTKSIFSLIFSTTVFTSTQMQWMEGFSYAVDSWWEGRVAPDTSII